MDIQTDESYAFQVEGDTLRSVADVRASRLDYLVVAFLALALRLAMAWAIPLANGSADPNCAPDEKAHFLLVDAIARGHVPQWPEETSSIYAAFPPAPYLLQALTLATFRSHADLGRFAPVEAWARGYEAARLGSALLGVVAVLALMAAAQAWTDSRAAGLAAGLIAATYPQSVFIGAYTNADAFTLAAGALLVLAVARWARRGEGSVALVPVGAAAGLVVLGKMSGYYLLPVTFLWAGWAVWTHRASARAGLLSLAACAGLSAPFLAWNALRNRGDALGLQRYGRFVAEHGTPVDKLDLPDAGSTFVFGLLKSSFGVFGNLHILMPGVFYLVAVGLLGAGCIVLFTGWGRASGVSRRAGLWLALGIVINLALVFLNSWYVDFQAQGRYILLNALLLTCIGVQGVDSLLEGRAPWAWRRFLVAFFALSAVVALGRVYQRPCQPVPVARATPAAPHHPVDPVR